MHKYQTWTVQNNSLFSLPQENAFSNTSRLMQFWRSLNVNPASDFIESFWDTEECPLKLNSSVKLAFNITTDWTELTKTRTYWSVSWLFGKYWKQCVYLLISAKFLRRLFSQNTSGGCFWGLESIVFWREN